MCPASHIGAQAYAVLIDSYGGYILESFAAHSVKKTKKHKRQRGAKKAKKSCTKRKRKGKKRKVKKNSEVLASCLVLVLRYYCLLN